MSLAAVPFLSGARLVASSPRRSSPMLGSARLYTSSPLLCAALPRCSMLFLCGSLSGSASRLRSGASPLTSIAACCNVARSISGAGYAFPERYGVSLCFSVAERCLRHGAVRCPRLPCHATQCLCFAIIAINASPSLRGEMPFRCVANPATLSLCLQCFSLTARYIAILSLLHVLLYLTQQVHSHAFQGRAFAPLI